MNCGLLTGLAGISGSGVAAFSMHTVNGTPTVLAVIYHSAEDS
jgi:hypothetical protein